MEATASNKDNEKYGQNFMKYVDLMPVEEDNQYYTYIEVLPTNYEDYIGFRSENNQDYQYVEVKLDPNRYLNLSQCGNVGVQYMEQESSRRRINFKSAIIKARQRIKAKQKIVSHQNSSFHDQTNSLNQMQQLIIPNVSFNMSKDWLYSGSNFARQQNKGFQAVSEKQQVKIRQRNHISTQPSYLAKFDPLQQKQKLNQNNSQFLETTHQQPVYTIFQEPLYHSQLTQIQKQLFRRECLKVKRKQYKSIDKQNWILILKPRSVGNKLQLSGQFINLDFKQRHVSLFSPRLPEVLINEGNLQYLFDFSSKFYPIVFNIENQLILAPICMISMLKPLQYEEADDLGNQSNMSISSSIEMLQQLHLMEEYIEVDQSIIGFQQLANILNMDKQDINEEIFYMGHYDFMGQRITIKMKYFHQMRLCGARVPIQNNPEKSVFSQTKILNFDSGLFQTTSKYIADCTVNQIVKNLYIANQPSSHSLPGQKKLKARLGMDEKSGQDL